MTTFINYFLAASRMPINPLKFHRWLKKFSTIQELFSANETDLQFAGLTSKDIAILKNPNWYEVENDLNWCEKNHCHLLSFTDENYPLLLKEISDPPLLLYVRGNIDLLSQSQIAMVGSRNPSVYGLEMAEQFAKYLAASGLIITSGLASGIDGASHKGALITGKTLAVLGTGVDTIYPAQHRKLAEEIIAQGALISEFPLNEKAKATNFPRRNRIISGLSIGVLVVEAALRSGSLITAKFALEQNREVFAIPGSIHNPMARGCHSLIRQGAKLVEKAEDILEEVPGLFNRAEPLSFVQKSLQIEPNLDEIHQLLLAEIGFETTSLDTIIVRSGLTASKVSSILLSLELSGFVQTVPGGYTRSTR